MVSRRPEPMVGEAKRVDTRAYVGNGVGREGVQLYDGEHDVVFPCVGMIVVAGLQRRVK